MTAVSRAGRASATREAILAAAERLFAEHGVNAVSLRYISETAGQGNNTAVSYHFGSKTELIRAIVRKHGEPTELARQRMVDAIGTGAAAGSADTARPAPSVRDWVTCLVRPVTDHLSALGSPTWFARFSAQLMTEPELREIVSSEVAVSPSLQRILDGLDTCAPSLPAPVHVERSAMCRHLIVHTCAEHERALAEGAPTPRSSWDDTATGLIDAITGLWLAPVTPFP
jgi:AcrR family transcriptional regulator